MCQSSSPVAVNNSYLHNFVSLVKQEYISSPTAAAFSPSPSNSENQSDSDSESNSPPSSSHSFHQSSLTNPSASSGDEESLLQAAVDSIL